jgi:hypothetical protein
MLTFLRVLELNMLSKKRDNYEIYNFIVRDFHNYKFIASR